MPLMELCMATYINVFPTYFVFELSLFLSYFNMKYAYKITKIK